MLLILPLFRNPIHAYKWLLINIQNGIYNKQLFDLFYSSNFFGLKFWASILEVEQGNNSKAIKYMIDKKPDDLRWYHNDENICLKYKEKYDVIIQEFKQKYTFESIPEIIYMKDIPERIKIEKRGKK